LEGMGGGDCREGIRHADLRRLRAQHERMRLVQAPPARLDLGNGRARCLRRLLSRGCASQVDEQAVGQVPELEIHYRALTAPSTFVIESRASPNSITVFGSTKSGLSIPAKPGPIERLSTTMFCAWATSRLGSP